MTCDIPFVSTFETMVSVSVSLQCSDIKFSLDALNPLLTKVVLKLSSYVRKSNSF